MERRLVYKVVGRDIYNLKSIFSCWVLVPLLTRYKIGEWVEAPEFAAKKGYYLTAFKTRDAAEKFMDGYRSYRYEPFIEIVLFIAEAEGIIEELPPQLDVNYIDLFLDPKNFTPEKFYLEDSKWPEGTIMAKRIKLLKELPIRKVWVWELD